MLLEDRTAVITGAASGIGRATAMLFAKHGADIVVADRRRSPREGGISTEELIEHDTDSRAQYVSCDVAEPDSLEAAFTAAANSGGLDVMVNNAGVFHHGNPLETSQNEYDSVTDVNARGTFFATQRAGRRMAENGGGSIVNVASTSAFDADGSIVAYSSSKAAVVQLTRAFAAAVGSSDIRVNVVCPGSIDTELSRDRSEVESEELIDAIPLGRMGNPADVARAILFLASDLSGYVTGETLVVDGGLTL